MKAAFITEPGPPSSIQYADLPSPSVGDHEILIQNSAVAVNPIDTYIRGGMIPMPIPNPFIVGCDYAGTVTATGSQVSRFQVGDRVWGSNQGLLGRQGTFAEEIAIDAAFAYASPSRVSDEDLASVALVSITAHLGLVQRAHLKSGETLLVNGGAGGVGSMVVQMGKALGARVIAVAGSSDRAKQCQEFGADIVINRTEDNTDEILRQEAASGIDVYWETTRIPDFAASIPRLAENGRMVVMAGRDAQPPFPVGPFYVKGCSLVGFAMFKATPEEQRTCATQINQWLSEGSIRAHIGRRFPLSEAAAAHQLQEDNTLNGAATLSGKIVLKP